MLSRGSVAALRGLMQTRQTGCNKLVMLAQLQQTKRCFADLTADEKRNKTKLALRFVTPYQILVEKEVDMVMIPGVDGVTGIMARHVPFITQLKAGVVSVHEKDPEKVDTWVVSGGFASVNDESVCHVTVAEALPLADFDGEAVREGLKKSQAAYDSADSPKAKAVAQIGLEMYQVLNHVVK